MIAPAAAIVSTYKSLDAALGRVVRGSVKAAASTMRTPLSGWNFALLPRTRFDYAREVGSGTQNSALMAVVYWIMRNFPEARVMVERQARDRGWAEDIGHKLTNLIETPNPFYSGVLLWMATVVDFVIHGNGYWWIERMVQRGADGRGEPLRLWWIPQHLIAPVGGGSLDNLIDHYDYTPGGAGEPIRVDPNDVVHFRWGLDPRNPIRGLSPVASLWRELFTDDEAANFSAALLKNFGIPGVVIIPAGDAEIQKEDADQMRGDFLTRFTGDGRGGPFIPSGKVDIKTLSFSPEQMSLEKLRRIPEERVSAVTGVPAVVAGLGAGLDRSTYNNVTEARQMAYENCIIPMQRGFSSDLKTQLLPAYETVNDGRVRVAFDTSQVRVLQEDEDKREARILARMAAGAVTVSSTQRELGVEVDETQNVYLRGVNVVEVPANEERPPPAPADESPEEALGDEAKALGWTKADPVRARARAIAAAEKRLRRELASLGATAVRRLLANEPKALKDVTGDPLSAQDLGELARMMRGIQFEATTRAYDSAYSDIGLPAGDSTLAVNAVLERLGVNITNVRDETLTQVREHVAEGIARGYSARQIAEGVPADGYRAMDEIDAFSPARAMRIARTEVATSENWAQVRAWEESGVVDEVRILDGDGCGWVTHDDGDKAHGTIRSLADFDEHPTAHPNCVRVGLPVVKAALRNGHKSPAVTR